LTYAVQQFFVNGGSRACVVRVAREGAAVAADAVRGAPDAKTGIYALDDVDLFNLLVLPDSAAADSRSVIAAALGYCERRRAFMVVDPPSDMRTLGQAEAWIEARERRGALIARHTSRGSRSMTRLGPIGYRCCHVRERSPGSMHGRTRPAGCGARPPDRRLRSAGQRRSSSL
jgi:hypothetical protein